MMRVVTIVGAETVSRLGADYAGRDGEVWARCPQDLVHVGERASE